MSSLYNDKKKKSSSVSERLCKTNKIELISKDSLKTQCQNFRSMNGIHDKQQNSNEIISNLLDNLNKNSLNIFYRDSSSIFKKKIDELNLKFYLETEKYLSNQNKQEKTQSSLFIILFKQIKVYIEEIERLNLIILQKKYEPRNIIERTDEILKKQKDLETKEQLIKTLKDSKNFAENKLSEILINEDKLKKENERLKQQNEIYKRQLSELNSNSQNNFNLNLSKTLTQSIFHSGKFNYFNTEEKKISDITKACSNLSGENINESALNKKRNNSENQKFSSTFSNGFSIYNQLVNNSEKKSIGIIKSVKEKMKREKKIYSLENFTQKKDTLNTLYNMNKPNLNINISNKSKEFDSFQEIKIDFNSFNSKENKNKTEVIVSDLEDYYSNYKQQNTIPISKNVKYNNTNISQIKNFNNNINNSNCSSCNVSSRVISNNNKRVSPKKIPVIQSIKVKVNK